LEKSEKSITKDDSGGRSGAGSSSSFLQEFNPNESDNIRKMQLKNIFFIAVNLDHLKPAAS
jgi:hypothetical protein